MTIVMSDSWLELSPIEGKVLPQGASDKESELLPDPIKRFIEEARAATGHQLVQKFNWEFARRLTEQEVSCLRSSEILKPFPSTKGPWVEYSAEIRHQKLSYKLTLFIAK